MAHAVATSAAIPRVVRSLDDLAELTTAECLALYESGRTPSVSDLDGDLVGRMLAAPWAGPFAGILRAWARSRAFPWRGKSFRSLSDARGEGINRVFGDASPRRWYRFETFVGPSRAGAFDALQLDYDNPGNPFFIRAIKDEVREVAPGLWLGQAWVVAGKRRWLAVYFGLQRA